MFKNFEGMSDRNYYFTVMVDQNITSFNDLHSVNMKSLGDGVDIRVLCF